MSPLSDSQSAEEVDLDLLTRFKEVLSALPTLGLASELTGYSTQQIAKWREGKARLPFQPAAILARAANRSVDWLAFGEGQRTESASTALAADDHDENIAFVPLLDVVASAGPGFENIGPYAIDALPFPRTWLNRLALPERYARFIDCRGDSMEPTISDGAIVLVDTRFQQTRGDGIYVLLDGPNVRIKRIAIGWEGALQLISDNERYEAEQLAPPDAEALRIAGKVVWAGGEL